jgi:hypothetical protein
LFASACGERADIVMHLRMTGASDASSRIRTEIAVCDPSGAPCAQALPVECPSTKPSCERSVGLFVTNESVELDIRFRLTSLADVTTTTCFSRTFELAAEEFTVEIRAASPPAPPIVSSCSGCDGELAPCPQ